MLIQKIYFPDRIDIIAFPPPTTYVSTNKSGEFSLCQKSTPTTAWTGFTGCYKPLLYGTKGKLCDSVQVAEKRKDKMT